ncbi:hypothetical protein [Schlesneria paludicola]|uniref:hypothetical protein n=1 Tax=Schlesneria paludicola TaxID=360056 RepID=UPI00029AE386
MANEAMPPAADRLRANMAATKISFNWYGVRKTLSDAQKERAADSFTAEATFLSAAKKLLDTRHAAYQAVTTVRGQILQYWRSLTLPYPESGVRLIRQDDIADFDSQLQRFQRELQNAVEQLDWKFSELKSSARQRLGDLYNSNDYPVSLRDEFGFNWEYPSIDVPDYLRQLNPRLYEQECQRIQSRFNEAVELAEQAFLDELGKLVGHLTERLAGADDGKPKIFRDSAVENLTDFFHRFRHLNVRSNAQLDELVAQTQQIIQGVRPQQLREDVSLRQQIGRQMANVQASLDGLLVDRPRRSIIRPTRLEEPA